MSNVTEPPLDFRSIYWGRSFYLRGDPDGVMRGLLHCTPGPRVGQQAIWCTEYGEALGTFLTVKWLVDPPDMFRAEVEIVARFDHSGAQIWERTEGALRAHHAPEGRI